MSTMSPRTLGILEFSAAMTLSGTLGYFVFESRQSAYNVVFFRCLFGALSLFAYCALQGLLKPGHLGWRSLGLALTGGAAIVANWVLLFTSYQYASISVATVVYHTQPFFLVLLGAILIGDRPGSTKLIWIGIAFVGLLMVIKVDEITFDLTSASLTGLLLAVGAAVLYAVATLITKQLRGIPPHLIALVQVSLGTLLLLPFADFGSVSGLGSHWIYLITLGVIHTCVMYILLYSGVQKLSVGPIAVLSFIYPAVAILVDYLVYGQNLSALQFAGIALILLGSAGVNLNAPPDHAGGAGRCGSARRRQDDHRCRTHRFDLIRAGPVKPACSPTATLVHPQPGTIPMLTKRSLLGGLATGHDLPDPRDE
jgi:drug/metabolite transporter (DMT)-like permease